MLSEKKNPILIDHKLEYGEFATFRFSCDLEDEKYVATGMMMAEELSKKIGLIFLLSIRFKVAPNVLELEA